MTLRNRSAHEMTTILFFCVFNFPKTQWCIRRWWWWCHRHIRPNPVFFKALVITDELYSSGPVVIFPLLLLFFLCVWVCFYLQEKSTICFASNKNKKWDNYSGILEMIKEVAIASGRREYSWRYDWHFVTPRCPLFAAVLSDRQREPSMFFYARFL